MILFYYHSKNLKTLKKTGVENNSSITRYFDLSKMFKSTKSFVDDFNENCFQTKEKINASHRATAELITRLYIKQLNRAISLGDNFENGLPPFSTYNSSLAKCKGCTVRTIINHKERLKASGFIVGESHCGKTGVEIHLNSAIVSKQSIFKNNVETLYNIDFEKIKINDKVKNFHPLVHEQQEQINNNSIVNKSLSLHKGVRQMAHYFNNNSVTGTIQEHYRNTEESRPSQELRHTNRAEEVCPEKESAFLLGLIQDFWKYTKATLYKGKVYSHPEETEILNHIWASVYRKLKIKGSKKDWKDYQEILYKRVDMVSRWLERSAQRWIPPAHLYFHPENQKNGFKKTYQWFIRQEVLKREIRNQILIQQSAEEWKKHNNGEGRHKNRTRLQLFRIQQKRLSNYNDEDLMRMFTKSLQGMVYK